MLTSLIYLILFILLIFPFINIISIIIIISISFYLSINIFIINILILLIILKAMIHLLYFILKNKVPTRKRNFKFFISDVKILYPSIGFTVLFFSYIFWNLVLLERLPRDLNYNFEIGFQTYFIGFLMLYFFFSSCIWLYLIKKNFGKNQSQNIYFAKYSLKIANFVEKYHKIVAFYYVSVLSGPKNTFYLFYYYLPVQNFIEFCQGVLIKFLLKKELYCYIILSLIKILLGLLFFFEVVINKNINFYYKLIFLLIIPLIFHSLLFIMSEHAKFSLENMQNICTFDINNNKINLYILTGVNTIADIEKAKQYTSKIMTSIKFHYKTVYFKKTYDEYKIYNKIFSFFTSIIYFITFIFYFLITLNLY